MKAGRTPSWGRRHWLTLAVLAVSVLVFVTALVLANQGRTHQAQSTALARVSYEQAMVVNVSAQQVGTDQNAVDPIETGTQEVLLRLTTGAFAGQTVSMKNYISTFNGLRLKDGDRITVYQYTDQDTGALDKVYFYEYDRTLPILGLLLAFFAVTVLVGGKTGLKSLLGLVLTVVCLIWILCPLLMKGADPLVLAFGLCVFVSVVSFVILGGVRRKTLCAILGTVAGMGLAALFGELAQRLCRITSYSMYSTDSLLDEFKNIQLQGIPLHIHGLLTAGIIISSLGAVMDVAMSLSSAIQELKSVNPGLGRGRLWRSAMNIGKDMVGTMTNTLILAFVGSSLIMLIYLWSLDLTARQLLTSSFFAVEVISSLSSSIGVILAVPLTALFGSVLYGGGRAEAK